ncbi:hypothetical protein BCR35DRAFT_318975 [Leucosporidium creatinivorum]|uniref:Carboxymuconolactone decarboxylase-like domain-containing protein n=1 Tax=Leucosporidium creatinivorum TaxID=106004 RepID=A0A1Y2ELL5_9BASI|nr:hypothetical protein BCR35DRAFT_318975 [Leucosporidium creatinivorum]
MAAPLTEAIPALLQRLSSTLQRPSASYILPAVVFTTLGQAHTWIGPVYQHAVRSLPPAPSTRSPSSLYPVEDDVPRRRVVRELKEAIQKSAILIGVPRAIEAQLHLGEVIEEGAKDDSFVREELEGVEPAEARRRGRAGLATVYQEDIGPIFEMMETDLKDVRWMSQQITYGAFLTPLDPPTADKPSRDPLAHDPALLSIVTLSAMVPQRTPREILWHLRGALRRGIPREEVETIHAAIAEVCAACGLKNVREGMPTVADVEVQKEERGAE